MMQLEALTAAHGEEDFAFFEINLPCKHATNCALEDGRNIAIRLTGSRSS
jgi:hypothetical protein